MLKTRGVEMNGQLQLTSAKKTLDIIYARWSLHCPRPRSRCFATFVAGKSNDFLRDTLVAIRVFY